MRRISCIGRDDGSGGVYTNKYTTTTLESTLHDGGHYTARRGTRAEQPGHDDEA